MLKTANLSENMVFILNKLISSSHVDLRLRLYIQKNKIKLLII